MSVEAFRLQNFMPFEDTDWIELRPICLLFGRNSSGKSAIIRALRFLRQSLDNQTPDTPFTYSDENGVDVGGFETVIHRHRVETDLVFSFRCTTKEKLEDLLNLVNAQRSREELARLPAEEFTPWVEIKLTYGYKEKDPEKINLKSPPELLEFSITGPWPISDSHNASCRVFEAKKVLSSAYSEDEEWYFDSDLLHGHEAEDDTAWYGVSIELVSGFLPALAIPIRQINGNSLSLTDRNLVEGLLADVCQDIKQFLQDFEYLGPIRLQPQRLYALDPFARQRWEKSGWRTYLRFLRSDVDQEMVDAIGKWMKALGLGEKTKPDNEDYKGDLAVIAQVKIQDSKNLINLIDTGYGASQVLPIIVGCVLAESDTLIVIEQPELHLHPGAQAKLADLLIEAATQGVLLGEPENAEDLRAKREEPRSNRVRFLIETHSEHILLRLRRRIAETSAGKLNTPKEKNWRIGHSQLSVLFVEQMHGQSSIYPIALTQRGEFAYTPAGFRDFFADDIEEVMALSQASRQVRVPEG